MCVLGLCMYVLYFEAYFVYVCTIPRLRPEDGETEVESYGERPRLSMVQVLATAVNKPPPSPCSAPVEVCGPHQSLNLQDSPHSFTFVPRATALNPPPVSPCERCVPCISGGKGQRSDLPGSSRRKR